jgi:hypothetical protein
VVLEQWLYIVDCGPCVVQEQWLCGSDSRSVLLQEQWLYSSGLWSMHVTRAVAVLVLNRCPCLVLEPWLLVDFIPFVLQELWLCVSESRAVLDTRAVAV